VQDVSFREARRFMIWLACCCAVALGQTQSRGVEDHTDLGIPYTRYTTVDSLGRRITFYLSKAPREKNGHDLPIVLFIQGSGCQSLFQKHGDRIGGGLQNLVLLEARKRARVLAVEKPGVSFLDVAKRPGSAEGASREFLEEHTLPRWAEANVAALRAAWGLHGVDRNETLVIGHSEGGIVAAMAAALEPKITHVAVLAGGGPSQLFDLAELRARPLSTDKPGDSFRRRESIYTEHAKILRDPGSITKSWLGHPYRRWSTFLSHSVTEELLKTKAALYLVQGTADTAVSITGFDVLVAELRARGRDFTFERIEGADHGFRTPEMPAGSPAGIQAVIGRVLTWFFKSTGK
jgi:pimeloyl-ACP methyl ester carboxylesterase